MELSPTTGDDSIRPGHGPHHWLGRIIDERDTPMTDVADDDPSAAAAETRRLWLRALVELDPHHADRSWNLSAEDLARSLCAAVDDERALLSLVNQALVLQQFLLEVACRPMRVSDRAAILDQADRLLSQPHIVAA
jgi:hypothetical protein